LIFSSNNNVTMINIMAFRRSSRRKGTKHLLFFTSIPNIFLLNIIEKKLYFIFTDIIRILLNAHLYTNLSNHSALGTFVGIVLFQPH
jgi:hypothetical protein